ncbi:MAG TPA: hypothetical protein VGJ69_08530 [Pyrinomonadaceae bacterium]|jgi:hypothetical protein
MPKYLNHPIIRYLIISATSILASVIFFKLGGSLAEISNTSGSFVGLSFKAGGALAGFLIFFLLSYRFIDQSANAQIRIKLHVTKQPKNFSDKDGRNYSCTGVVYNPDSNEERRMPLITRWEAGYLTMDFVDLGPNEWIGAEISDQSNQVWRVHYFDPRTNIKEV